MGSHETYMARAIDVARVPVATSPNPRVGAVVVRDGEVVAEGTHRGAGTPHAETEALTGIDARGATMYVTLEPCVHEGRTPPCAPAVVASGVARVVVAIEDADPRVAGAGLRYLRDHNVEVITGVLEHEARQLNRAYLHQRATGRPLVTLKLALSLDGKLAASDGSSRWITGPAARRRVHARRAECDAILVGAGTVLADDPALTARDVGASRQPVRIVCDGSGRVPPGARLFREPGEVIVATTLACPQDRQASWKEAGAEVIVVDQDQTGRVDLRALLIVLSGRGWLEICCEGGAGLATSILRTGLADRLELYRGPVLLGGEGIGIGPLDIPNMDRVPRWKPVYRSELGPDTLTVLDREL